MKASIVREKEVRVKTTVAVTQNQLHIEWKLQIETE